MRDDCAYTYPQNKNGTSQTDRYPVALEINQKLVDRRGAVDLLLWAWNYSRYLKFYPSTAADPAKHWQKFFSSSDILPIAGLIKIPLSEHLHSVQLLLNRITRSEENEDEQKASFKAFLFLPFALFQEFDNWYRLFQKEDPFKQVISAQIDQLKAKRNQLAGYIKGAAQQGYIAGNPHSLEEAILTAAASHLPDEIIESLTASSNLREIIPEFDSISVDALPFQSNDSTFREQFFDAWQFAPLRMVYQFTYQWLQEIQQLAIPRFDQLLTGKSDYQSHYGLLLTFVKLYEAHQNRLNKLAYDHLQYYYKDILQVPRSTPEPHDVHVLLTLAPGIRNHLIEQGQEFDGGRDGEVPVVYEATSSLVVNQAQVASIDGIHQQHDDDSTTIHAGRQLNENESDQEGSLSWNAFGSRSDPEVRLGFAISDRMLNMRQGQRTISLQISGRNLAKMAELGAGEWEVQITGEEGWMILDPGTMAFNNGNLNWTIGPVTADVPQFVDYDQEIHEDVYSTPYPVLMIRLKGSHRYVSLRDVIVEDVQLYTRVDGITQFGLANDLGTIDPSKSFRPFGDRPRAGDAIYLGYPEIFLASNDKVQVEINWKNRASGQVPESVSLEWSLLNAGQFTEPEGNTILQGETGQDTLDREGVNQVEEHVLGNLTEELSPSSQFGIMRLRLAAGLGHDEYDRDLTNYLIDRAKGVPDNVNPEPEKRYTPEVDKLLLSYKRQARNPHQFYHLHPFGVKRESIGPEIALLPRFPNQGEMYIALQDLNPPEQVAILFQFKDGSANPLVIPQNLEWSYLAAGDTWVPFEPREISDQTNGFSGSGIITFALSGQDARRPAKAQQMMDPRYYWLKLSVAGNIDGIPRLQSIATQALKLQLVQPDQHPDWLLNPLPSEQITDFITPHPEIQEILQPFESFAGKSEEEEKSYYLRISERLRHKDRGMQMWDYERLVLQAFPEIFKVKCINHFEAGEQGDKVTMPGHVTLVVLPLIKGRSYPNPLQPYADLRLLRRVREYVQTKISPFIQLQVVNPNYQVVKVSFKIKFVVGLNDIEFYIDRLNREIIEYLSPWAFDQSHELSFEGQWYKSTIIDFIDELSYVDYLEDFRMYPIDDPSGDYDQLIPGSPRTILVSTKQHDIREIENEPATSC